MSVVEGVGQPSVVDVKGLASSPVVLLAEAEEERAEADKQLKSVLATLGF